MIIYTNEEILFPAAKKLEVTGIHISPNELTINLQWYASDDSPVKTGVMSITGTDFTEIMQTNIGAGAVGTPIGVYLKRGILNKVKTMLGITGTIE